MTLESQKIEKWHRNSKSQKAPHAWTDGDAGQMSQGEDLKQKDLIAEEDDFPPLWEDETSMDYC